MEDVEFGNKLETIGESAFASCKSLRHLENASVRIIGAYCAFYNCTSLIDAEFGTRLESIGRRAFCNCYSLRRISIPLKGVTNLVVALNWPKLILLGVERSTKLFAI
jgi:hypothetical protein